MFLSQESHTDFEHAVHGGADDDALEALGGEGVDGGVVGYVPEEGFEAAGGAEVVEADDAVVGAGEEDVVG